MNNKELIFKYLSENSDVNAMLTISNVKLGKEIGCTQQTIIRILKELVTDGVIFRDKQTITINKSKLVIDDLLIKRNLNYSNKEKELLYYIYNEYQKKTMEGGFEYVCISYESIKQNTTITKGKVIKMYLSKYQTDGILDILQGDYKKKQSNKYKFIFDDIDNTNIQKKSNENQIDNNELLEKYNTLLSLYEQLNKRVEYLEKEHNQQHTDDINIDIDKNDDTIDDTIDDDLLKYLDIETEENDIPNDMTEEEIQEKQQKQEKTYNMVDTIIINKQTLIQKIENMNLNLSETDIKVLDKLISKSNALNDCVCIIGVLDSYEKVLYTLPKVTDDVFDCIVTYFSTIIDDNDTIDRLYKTLI